MLDSPPSSTNLPPGIQTGDIVANRYRLEEVVGRGGMAVVVAARHLELDERVAVKFMSPDALSDPEAVARFDREVRAAARIKSEYVARVYDAGKLSDGRRYMVLEFLEGEDLSARIRRDGPLPPEQAIRFALQASSALLEAHGLGIIHRDLKPANLRVVRRTDGSEIVKVLDFGVMKRMPGVTGDTATSETQPGTVVGTPLYTSPEQLRGSNDIDARADIWSLGATLFELLTGSPPFGGRTYPQIIANVLESAPPPIRALRAEISDELASVVMRCLEKLPENRYDDIAELARALAETIDLDAELRGLIERISRQLKSQPLNPSVGPQSPGRATTNRDLPRGGSPAGVGRATPNHVREAPASPSRSTSTNGYRRPPGTSRGLALTAGAAVVSALLVVALGMPWLPNFRPRSSGPPANAPNLHSAGAPAARATASAADNSDSPAHRTLPPDVPSSPPVAASVAPAKSTNRRPGRPSDASNALSPTRTSEPAPSPSSGPSAVPSNVRKNPLLVAPW